MAKDVTIGNLIGEDCYLYKDTLGYWDVEGIKVGGGGGGWYCVMSQH